MCGILAILLASVEHAAAPEICEGLNLLQHRGQDACGIVTCGRRGRFYQTKSNGMVRDVLDERAIGSLQGSMGVGHVRYPTAGSSAHAEAQPFYVNSPYGIVFAHNGNLINTPHLRYYLDQYAHRHINTDSDSELMLNILADNLQKTGKFRIDEDDVFRAIGEMMRQCAGAYAVVAMLAGFGIIAFRDPNGIRPVGFARRPAAAKSSSATSYFSQSGSATPGDLRSRDTQSEYDYIMASESVCADALGFSDWQDVKPGEAIIITRHSVTSKQCVPPRTFAPDIFEYVYFARPDSVLDGVSVYRSRMAMGEALAGEVERQLKAHNLTVDVVIPVPDTSRVAALQCAQSLAIPYREGFVKNRYVGRTFIMPGQQMRRKNVRRKLNAMALEFQGRNVMLVDDSIVRGTTSREIVQMARDAGARKVIVASCAPPIRYPNVYGIDMPSRKELVAHGRTVEEVSKEIGADLVVFQTLPDLEESCRQLNSALEHFDCSVFTGEYITGGVDQTYLEHVESLRADNIKHKAASMALRSGVDPANATNASSKAANGTISVNDNAFGCSGPMSGAESLIGLAPSLAPEPNGTDSSSVRDSVVGLSNSFHSSMSLQQAVEQSSSHEKSRRLSVSGSSDETSASFGPSMVEKRNPYDRRTSSTNRGMSNGR